MAPGSMALHELFTSDAGTPRTYTYASLSRLGFVRILSEAICLRCMDFVVASMHRTFEGKAEWRLPRQRLRKIYPSPPPLGSRQIPTSREARKMKKPKGTSLAVALLSLLCIAIYGAIGVGLASQIGKAPGVVQGVTADN